MDEKKILLLNIQLSNQKLKGEKKINVYFIEQLNYIYI